MLSTVIVFFDFTVVILYESILLFYIKKSIIDFSQ